MAVTAEVLPVLKATIRNVLLEISNVKALNLTTATVGALGFMMRVVKTAAMIRLEDVIPIPAIRLIPVAETTTLIQAIPLIQVTTTTMVILRIPATTTIMEIPAALPNAQPENTNAKILTHIIVPTAFGIPANSVLIVAIPRRENATQMIQVAHQEIPNA